MKIKTAYEYIINNQTVIVYDISLVPNTIEPIELIHLCADEGKILTNGQIKSRCVNTFDASEWYEIDAPVYDYID
jgi:hypothetical protein